MEKYVFPVIGDKDVAEIGARDILTVLEPIWFVKHETATRVLQRVENVLSFAILNEYREKASPCVGVKDVLGTRLKDVEHHPALPLADVPAFIQHLRSADGVWPMTRLAFEMLILTAVRSGEVRGARFDEFDLEDAVWRISAERMKTKKVHSVRTAKRPNCALGNQVSISVPYVSLQTRLIRAATFQVGLPGSHKVSTGDYKRPRRRTARRCREGMHQYLRHLGLAECQTS